MNPILVNVFRNETLESFHRGAVAAVNASGELVYSLGDIDTLVFPRSALKPIQAIPLLETGAAQSYGLTAGEIALACASHNAEPVHRGVLSDWMTKVELDDSMLECGPALPMHTESAQQWLRDGHAPMRALHNCSGKHTGMLTLAKFLDSPLKGYSDYDHQTQQQWMQALTDLSGIDSRRLPWDRDGCGLPALALPLKNFAFALARFCAPEKQTARRAQAMKDILDSMHSYSHLVAGSARCCTATMKAHKDVVVKTGAEGVFAAIAPSAELALALKIDDGATRAADAALGAALKKLGLLSREQYCSLAQWYEPQIRNSQEVVVGKLEPSSVWSQ